MPLKVKLQDSSFVPGDREDGSSSFVHMAIVSTGKLGKVPTYYLVPVWFVLFLITFRIWQNSLPILFICLLSLLFDWTVLRLLPVKNRSWGPVTPPLLGLTLLRTTFRIFCGLVISPSWKLGMTVFFEFVTSIVTYYATWIEPFRIKTTHLTLKVPVKLLSREVKILQISDIHYEGLSLREENMLEIVRNEAPDAIMLTGDYLNLSSVFDTTAHNGIRELLSVLKAPLGIYAVSGSPAVDHQGIVPEIFSNLPIKWLMDDFQQLPDENIQITVVGVINTYDDERDLDALNHIIAQLPDNGLNILLYHTPDLMPAAIDLDIDLYMCGHTHGGQISLPFYGALFTSSKYGKRFEHGYYHSKKTHLYVSSGLGMEGMGAPRARLFAQPEIIVWSLIPDANKTLTTKVNIV
jgi:predicted MPP superfamily phosphohydrolase